MNPSHGVTVDKNVIEQLSHDFLSKDFKAVQPYPIYRINVNGLRVYVKVFDDHSYMYGAGTTSILKKVMPESIFLTKWQRDMSALYGANYTKWYLEHAANYGTYYHVLCGSLLRNESIDLSPDVFFNEMEKFYFENGYNYYEGLNWYHHANKNYKKDILSFIQWVQDYDIEPIAMEYGFVTGLKLDGDYDVAFYAGTIDLICRATIGGKRQIILVDLKTSKNFYDSHEAQLYLYAKAWNQEDIHNVVPGLRVEKIYNFAPKDWKKDKPTYNFKNQTTTKQASVCMMYLKMFESMNDIRPGKTTEIKDEQISIKSQVTDLFVEKDHLGDVLKWNQE